MIIPRFCEESSLWIPSNSLAHEGAFGYHQWKRLFKKKKQKAFDFIVWLPPIIIAGLLIAKLTITPADRILNLVLLNLSSAYLVLSTGIHVYFGFVSRSHFLSRIFQIDLWVGVFLLSLAAEIFLNASVVRETGISFIALGSFLWLQLRTLEVYLWKRRLTKNFRSPDLFWSAQGIPEQVLRTWELLIVLISLLIIGTVILINKTVYSPSFYIAAFLPALIPQFLWLITQLLSKAEKEKFVCQDFAKFRNLRKTELTIFNQCGVLTTDDFKAKELWVDHNEDFTEAEVKDALLQLASLAKHPLSDVILSELSGGRSLMKLEKSEVRKNLGIIADFEDLQRRKTNAQLAGLTWHKLLRHEISEQGMEKIRKWKQEKLWTTFLSLNRQVVAAIAWTAPLRNKPKKGFSKVPAVVISSQPHLAEGISEEAFDQVTVGLLPLERELQQKYWAERVKNILEITAAWDSQPTNAVMMVSQRSDLNTAPLGILNGEIQAVSWAINASSEFERKLKLFALLSITAVTASLFNSSGGWGLTCVIYLSSLAYFTKRP